MASLLLRLLPPPALPVTPQPAQQARGHRILPQSAVPIQLQHVAPSDGFCSAGAIIRKFQDTATSFNNPSVRPLAQLHNRQRTVLSVKFKVTRVLREAAAPRRHRMQLGVSATESAVLGHATVPDFRRFASALANFHRG